MSCYVHHLPGRLRVRIPEAKGNATKARRLVNRLNRLEGITSVAANPVTGSILIRYDTTITNADACLAILNVPESTPQQSRLAEKMAEAAIWFIVEKALERCLLLLI